MKNVRINMTNDEKLAQEAFGTDSTIFSMGEDLNDMIQKEKAAKYNEEAENIMEDLQNFQANLETVSKSVGMDHDKIEIKPMQDHVLVKPFDQNPFQKMKIDNETGLITDLGGFQAGYAKNPTTGKYEEQPQVIFTAAVVEVGPEVKYLKEGDVIYYHKRNALPIPFFKFGLWDVPEYSVLAVVNEGLTERFKK